MSTAFRLFDPFQVFTDQHGQLASGGSLNFFVTGTTTPKDVFSDPGLTVNLGNVVQIGSDGRPVSDIWGSDSYRARLLDASSVQIGPDRDSIAIPGGGAAALPTPFIPNALLSNDGSLPLWLSTILMPDPTGHANNLLGTDGTAVFWQTVASLGIPSIAHDATSLTIGAVKIQWGSDTAPASGFRQTSKSTTFPVPFSGVAYHVGAVATTTTACVGLQIGVPAITSKSASGFSVQFDSDDFSQTNAQFTSPLTYDWFAIGPA